MSQLSVVASFDVDELGEYLVEKGVPSSIALSFTDNQIDGEAFLELTEADVKELVKPLGVVKKIIRLIREVTPSESKLPSSSQDTSSEDPVPSSSQAIASTSARSRMQSPSLFSPPTSPSPSQASTISVANSNSSSTPSGFPLNFTIPTKWRPSIMCAITENKLTPDIRNEVVRDLVTHMYGYMEKPSSSFCKYVAQRLILQYKFMRDSMGTGYGSWEKKLNERVSNVFRKRKLDSADENPPKKGRPRSVAVCLDDRYPVVNSETSFEEAETAFEALRKEMSNAKPRRDIFLPLMKTTFSIRRHYVMHDALSVQDILREYPAMKQTNTIEQEMELILSRPGVLNIFTSEWKNKWMSAIIEYCRALKRKDIAEFISHHDSTTSTSDNERDEKLALGLLVALFVGKKQNVKDLLKNVYEICLIGEDPDIVAAQPPVRNSPRFAEFMTDGGETTYYIFVEQKTLWKTSSFTKAFFLWFCAHYVFHLSYSTQLTELCTFVQEFIFGLPAKGRRTTSYLTISTDIQQLTVR